ncbi:hypothetical protein KL86DYS2_12101 [uncultured Dysgonomonas sp.]|uniref:Uncharacterized protein n=1 Tax=uncultured Dysgonomonas sp. TaxID=206096 RepID=A0A212JQL5_9BACT|nr:hypothetical protein KL86DYS2_12101 [uncultured Dysgonomonas sp.]
MQVVTRFGLTVVHGIFFHTHKGGTFIGLGVAVAIAKCLKMMFIFL